MSIKILVNIIIISEDSIFRLIYLNLRNQFSSQLKKPLEFLSAIIIVLLNNSFYLYGIYLLAVLQVENNQEATTEYLASTGMVLTSWGILNIFAGGLFQIGSYIETGELDAYLSKPRYPLFLISLSKSSVTSIAEIIQGICTIVLISFISGYSLGMRALISSLVMTFAFTGILIIVGSLSFFSSRGAQLSNVILQLILTVSLFPITRALKGNEILLLYFTPLVMTTTMPRLFTLEGNWLVLMLFLFTTLLTFLFSIGFFNFGLKYYKAKNYIIINS